MPTFDSMKKKFPPKNIGQQLREESVFGVNATFKNTTRYREGMLYDCDMKELTKFEFKHHKVKKYTITGDQVEYHVQFRPNIAPEIMYGSDSNNYLDKRYRLGMYIDIPNENTDEIEKWIIVGKDSGEFDRYIVLKCNWTFEWIDHNGQYRKCLGCMRDRMSYNSGGYKTRLLFIKSRIFTPF